MSYHFDFSSGNADQRNLTTKAPLKVKEGRGGICSFRWITHY